jgi:hypothetical protein
VTVTGGTFCCAGWRATATAGRLALSGSGAAIDGLRALCAAAWSAGGVSADAAANALARLDLSHPAG